LWNKIKESYSALNTKNMIATIDKKLKHIQLSEKPLYSSLWGLRIFHQNETDIFYPSALCCLIMGKSIYSLKELSEKAKRTIKRLEIKSLDGKDWINVPVEYEARS
jgi:hypothetical protein